MADLRAMFRRIAIQCLGEKTVAASGVQLVVLTAEEYQRQEQLVGVSEEAFKL